MICDNIFIEGRILHPYEYSRWEIVGYGVEDRRENRVIGALTSVAQVLHVCLDHRKQRDS